MAAGSKNVAWIIAALAAVTVCAVIIVTNHQKKALEEQLAGAEAARSAAPAEVESEAAPVAADPSPFAPAPTPMEVEAEAPVPDEPLDDALAEPVAEDEEQDQERNQGQRIADAQMMVMMNIAYGPLFDELGLQGSKREEALAIMVASSREVQAAAQKALRSKDKTASEIKALEDASEAAIREQLQQLLDPAELAAWDEYQEYADQIMFAQLLDGQLTMLSPGLNAEGREVAKEVFAEELKLHLDAFGESDEIYTMDAFNAAQLDALLAGLERLAGDLPADQLGHAEGFVKQVETVFATMAGQ